MARRSSTPATPTLFEAAARRGSVDAMPLAERVRPTRLAEVFGHEELIGEGKVRFFVDDGALRTGEHHPGPPTDAEWVTYTKVPRLEPGSAEALEYLDREGYW